MELEKAQKEAMDQVAQMKPKMVFISGPSGGQGEVVSFETY